MILPAFLPVLLGELDRLGVVVESFCVDRESISIETRAAYYQRSTYEFTEEGDAAEWAAVIASLDGEARA